MELTSPPSQISLPYIVEEKIGLSCAKPELGDILEVLLCRGSLMEEAQTAKIVGLEEMRLYHRISQ